MSATALRPAEDAAAAPAVVLERLSRRYGRQLVLHAISLEVAPGRVVVLRGRNGSGKTTFLRVLATRLRPSRGRGRVFGFDLVRDGGEVRRRIAYLSALGGSYGALTGRENLRLAARLRSMPDGERLEAALERVGLAGDGDKPVRTYSSGMKKRLALARLLLGDAALWLLDEPYTALDAEGRAVVDALLSEARAAGRTVLVASHEPERLAGVADGVLELELGQLRRVPTAARQRAEGGAVVAATEEAW